MNVVATLVARKALVKAANGQYTEAELAELGKNKRRAEPKKESEPGASKKTQSDSEMPPLEETSANTQVGKDAVGTNAKTMTTGSGPVSSMTDSQCTPVLIDAEGPRGTDVEAPPHDLKSCLASAELYKYPCLLMKKRAWWEDAIGIALRNLFLHQCVEHAEKWEGACLFFMMMLTW
jgi:hypothetical protein